MTIGENEAAVLQRLRDDGPQRLSTLNEEAIDACFKAKPKLVFIHTYGEDPKIDITTTGLVSLAEWETRRRAS